MNTLANSLKVSLGTLKNWEGQRSRPIRKFWPAIRRMFRPQGVDMPPISGALPRTCFQPLITILFSCENDVFQSDEKTGISKSRAGAQGSS